MKKWCARKTEKSVWIVLLSALVLFLLPLNSCRTVINKPLFEVEALPYEETALEPYMSAETLRYHYGKHYTAYVQSANRLAKQSRLGGKTPEDLMRELYEKRDETELFNQVCQAWNHAFFWKSLRPGGGGNPRGQLADKIMHDFGSYDKFKAAFITAAGEQFGSGWVWLVIDQGRLKIIRTANADSPVAFGMTPLFVVDVWEHAYYLDYRHQRIDYVKAVLENLAHWDFAEAELEKHMQNSKPES